MQHLTWATSSANFQVSSIVQCVVGLLFLEVSCVPSVSNVCAYAY